MRTKRKSGNGIFGPEHKGLVETALKRMKSEDFTAKLKDLAAMVAEVAAISGSAEFSIADLDANRIFYRDVQAAGRLIDTMKHLIKVAVRERGDYWYSIEMVHGWIISLRRGKPKVSCKHTS
jgi:hypothetical protein